jgi:hypothetical protein
MNELFVTIYTISILQCDILNQTVSEFSHQGVKLNNHGAIRRDGVTPHAISAYSAQTLFNFAFSYAQKITLMN